MQRDTSPASPSYRRASMKKKKNTKKRKKRSRIARKRKTRRRTRRKTRRKTRRRTRRRNVQKNLKGRVDRDQLVPPDIDEIDPNESHSLPPSESARASPVTSYEIGQHDYSPVEGQRSRRFLPKKPNQETQKTHQGMRLLSQNMALDEGVGGSAKVSDIPDLDVLGDDFPKGSVVQAQPHVGNIDEVPAPFLGNFKVFGQKKTNLSDMVSSPSPVLDSGGADEPEGGFDPPGFDTSAGGGFDPSAGGVDLRVDLRVDHQN